MMVTIDIPEQTVYEIQALAIAKGGDCPITSPEHLDGIMDRLVYSIHDVLITILMNKFKSMKTGGGRYQDPRPNDRGIEY